jgi:LPS sulfotransferase NodH
MKSQPLFVIGAPRSGTTLLCHVLNQHPLIELTNESRIFVWLKDLIDIHSGRPELIGRKFRRRFVKFVRDGAGDWIERFYREGLGLTAPIWGDKHPPYADPAVLSRRKGSIERLPRSGSCLRLIRSCLPRAKFIHIHRDPRDVARSLARKGWTQSVEDGVRVWQQYAGEIIEFFGELDDRSRLTISYRELLDRPQATAAVIGRFLGLSDWTSIEKFLMAQRLRPTPFSDPVTDVSAAYRARADSRSNDWALAMAGEPAVRLGYTKWTAGPRDRRKARR